MKPLPFLCRLLPAGTALVAFAQVTTTNPPPKAAGFSFPYKKDGRTVSLSTGADLQPLSPTLYRIHGFRVETFNPDGTPNLIGEGPECLLNLETWTVSSAGPLRISQAGGTFLLTGEGFTWSHKTERLQLSNHVHATFRLAAQASPFPLKP